MLASQTLPPISLRPPSPIVTFINIFRRYTKSTMQVTEHGSDDRREDGTPVSPSQRLRKRTRINDTRDRVSSLSSPAGRQLKSQGPTSDPSSPRSTRKRATSALDTSIVRREINIADSPTDLNPSHSAVSNASGEWSGQICICQPEPKIPRPRNGELSLSVIALLEPSGATSNKESGLYSRIRIISR